MEMESSHTLTGSDTASLEVTPRGSGSTDSRRGLGADAFMGPRLHPNALET